MTQYLATPHRQILCTNLVSQALHISAFLAGWFNQETELRNFQDHTKQKQELIQTKHMQILLHCFQSLNNLFPKGLRNYYVIVIWWIENAQSIVMCEKVYLYLLIRYE